MGSLNDPSGTRVESEKILEVDFENDSPVVVGKQFGIGQLLPGPDNAKMASPR